mgnify:CR=1 FL=1
MEEVRVIFHYVIQVSDLPAIQVNERMGAIIGPSYFYSDKISQQARICHNSSQRYRNLS